MGEFPLWMIVLIMPGLSMMMKLLFIMLSGGFGQRTTAP